MTDEIERVERPDPDHTHDDTRRTKPDDDLLNGGSGENEPPPENEPPIKAHDGQVYGG